MSDITMCDGGNCSLKNGCYRFTAHVNDNWQSYFVHIPFWNGQCEYFIDNHAKDKDKNESEQH